MRPIGISAQLPLSRTSRRSIAPTTRTDGPRSQGRTVGAPRGKCLGPSSTSPPYTGRYRHPTIQTQAALELPGLPAQLFRRSEYDQRILALAVPSFLTSVIDPILSSLDSAIVGHLGTEALAGVSIGIITHGSFTSIFLFLFVLTTPAVATAFARAQQASDSGAGFRGTGREGGEATAATAAGKSAQDGDKHETVSEVVSQHMWVAGLGAVLAVTLCLAIAPRFVAAQTASVAVQEAAMSYINCRLIGVPAVLVSFVAGGCLLGLQDTKTNLKASLAAAVVNMSLNFLLVYGFHMGVGGVALATSIANYTSLSVLLHKLLLQPGPQGRPLVDAQGLLQWPQLAKLWSLLRKGAALSLRFVAFQAVMLTSTKLVAAQGAVELATLSVARQLWILLVQGTMCFRAAVQPIIASSLASSDTKAALVVLKRGLVLGTLGMALLAWPAALNRDFVARLFSSDPLVLEKLRAPLVLLGLTCWLDALTNIFDGSLIACGQTSFAAMATICSSCCGILLLQMLGAVEAVSVMSILLCFKIIYQVIPAVCYTWRLFFWPQSPFLQPTSTPMLAVST